nr:hypothetical protein [Tanacetum cinerariifolium]
MEQIDKQQSISKTEAEAHPDNMVALVPMGPLQGSRYARPTRDLDEILFALKG